MRLKAFYVMYPGGKAPESEKRVVRGALLSGAWILLLLNLAAYALAHWLTLGMLFFFKTLSVYLFIFMVMLTQLTDHRPSSKFGSANQITLVRAGLVALLCGFIGESLSHLLLWYAVMIGLLGTMLDGVDGWLARREGLVSRMGARFDMEIDALHILILSVLAFQSNKAGVWVLTAGALRYLFLVVGYFIPWLASELAPSRRRQSVCVIQIVSLIVCLSPAIPAPWSGWIAASGVILLIASFLIDSWHLARSHYHKSLRRMT